MASVPASPPTPAEVASKKALDEMLACIKAGQSFLLEAGAGAGKTYSLIKGLEYLIDQHQRDFARQRKQIACITFTNVAKAQIEERIDKNPLVYCDTNHAFCWSLISNFQKQLRELLPTLPKWPERIAEVGGLGDRSVSYKLGFRAIRDKEVLLHHDDVLPLTIALMENAKFRLMISDRFPVILIDEYQDTDGNWVEAIKKHFLGQPHSPLFGFFGDHWQKIYGDGCGKLEHPALKLIGKEANFRSVQVVVDALNKMRPELPQFVKDPKAPGVVRIFHTNSWKGSRQAGAHWAGDLPTDAAHAALDQIKAALAAEGWDLSADSTKILMLTHRLLANEQGYGSLVSVFRYAEAFSKKEHAYIAYFVDVIEPACDAFADRKFGAMFHALGGDVPHLSTNADKKRWNSAMSGLIATRDKGTVGDVLDYLMSTRIPRLSDAVYSMEKDLKAYVPKDGEEMPPSLREVSELRKVSYQEIKNLRRYLAGFSPFETKHGVKGDQFENVIVVIGRGWNHYNFGEMLEFAGGKPIPAKKAEGFERNRNLFYVACSRAQKRLALLFTQQLSTDAIKTLTNWFGTDALVELEVAG